MPAPAAGAEGARTHSSSPVGAPRSDSWRRFGALYALGFIGVLSLVPMLLTMGRQQLEAMPEIGLSLPVLVGLSLINPLIMLSITVAMGIRLAPPLGLRSYLDERIVEGASIWPRLRRDLPLAVLLGIFGGTLLLLLDGAFARVIPELQLLAESMPRTAEQTIMGVLYGGITEELTMRWGVMSFLVWVGMRLTRREGLPAPALVRAAIVGAALIFGLGHLPAMAALIPLTPLLIVRTIGLNAIGGLIFGWIFWRRALEPAMIAHATFHLTFTLVAFLA